MQLAQLLESAAQTIQPPPDRTADQWADSCRILPPEAGEPGPWRTDRVPYMREPYQAASNPACKTLVMMCGSQMSKTEMELNILGHRFDDGPYVPALYVGPSQKQVSSMSRDRFQKMISEVPGLWGKLARGQDDKIAEKWIGGVRLGFAWAGSPIELSSHPAGLAVVDEVDRMEQDISGEGDPVELVRARLVTYPNGLLVVVSTPTRDGASAIDVLFEDGTMHKWAWPCDHCGYYFIPRRALLSYTDSKDLRELKNSAVVCCDECGGAHDNTRKRALNHAGIYVPHVLSDEGEHTRVDIVPYNPCFSYWVSGLASPWATFGDRAEAIAKAERSGQPSKIQAVINTNFGEKYAELGEAPEYHEILELKNDIARGTVPEWCQLLTAGCDVQKNGIFYTVRAWGFNDRSHLVDHGFIAGDTAFDNVWMLWQQSIVAGVFGRDEIPIRRVLVDSGYNPGRDRFRRPEHQVYKACRRTQGRAMPSKGRATMDRPMTATKIEMSSKGKIARGSIVLWIVNTDHFKTWLREQCAPMEGQPPGFTLHADTDEDYARQMAAEELITRPNGKREWVCGRSKDNHYFDCEVLARAAAVTLQAHRLPRHAPAPTAQAPGARPAPQTGGRFERRGGAGFERR